ncbi:Fur family transcriptional regulator [Trueperella bialowiezensis]|uniref:Ferric uptake regulation protein n=1 Tax=Trueperella bialowiezensis TaxID=312285 RepID=A0A3S4YY38_9ACTO|nr:Fur family transcriptional regulator [Trueperella bialowiezensis]VEI13375.1 Ferric uptake regulation protein [Trueperella bialowiezensis]
MERPFKDQLRDVGLRVTRPRLSVLEELSENPHSSADQVRKGVTRRLGSVSTQAIYDVLHALTEKRLLREIEPHGSVPLYELARPDNHHHLVCRSCRKIVNIPCVIGAAPCLTPDDDHGFTIDEAEVVFWGFCPDCEAGSDTE